MKLGVIFDMDGTMFDMERLYQEAWDAEAFYDRLTHQLEQGDFVNIRDTFRERILGGKAASKEIFSIPPLV